MAIPGYKILRKIGDGGMSTVYLSIQLSVGREVALKVLSPELRSDPSFGDRFFREANIVGALSHPNIIAIYDVGKQDEHYYIAMDYLPGQSCSERIKTGDLSLKEILSIIKNIASALDYAHERGFVHCDVKPDNILFRHDGSAVLTDFGIATSTSSASKTPGIKAVAGTPHYMSPEQTQGQSIDGRSDLYSLGILFYEMLAGERPYKGKDAIALAVKHLTAPIPQLPSEYKIFQALLNRMLAKKPGSRYQCGKEIVDAITALEGSLGKERGITNTEPTALQAFSLLEALLATFGHVSKEMLKRFFSRFEVLTRLRLSKKHGLVLTKADSLLMFDKAGYSEENSLDETSIFEPSATNVNTRQFSSDLDDAVAENRAIKIVSPALIALLTMFLFGAAGLSFYHSKSINTDTLFDSSITSTPNADQGDMPEETATDYSQGNTSASPEKSADTPSFSKNVHEYNADKEKISAKAIKTTSLYRLTINTSPQNARVRILNIKPRYQDGIQLAPGKYHISVKAKGYAPYSRWIIIEKDDRQESITLNKFNSALKTGNIIRDSMPKGKKAPAIVVITAGNFMMGGNINADEKTTKPAHKVSIKRAFAIGVKEVSYAEYDIFAKDTQRELPESFGNNRSAHPVSGISWLDASAYTAWLTEKTGKHYRLPTEAEWEYAARAGTTGNYWWQQDSAKKQANCRKGCNSPWVKIFSASSAPVGSFSSNQFGLYDTAGNVAEWVEDCFQEDYKGVPVNGGAWRNPECKHYAVRGGSFKSAASEITNASRSSAKPGKRHKTIGFRIARDL